MALSGVAARDQLEQVHVPRREEEVGAQEAPLDVVGQRIEAIAFTDRPEELVDTMVFGPMCLATRLEQVLLDVETLDHRLHDPVDVGQLRQVVVEVARGEQLGAAGVSEGGGTPLGGRGDAVAWPGGSAPPDASDPGPSSSRLR